MKVAILGYGGQGKSSLEYWNTPENDVTVCALDESIQLPAGITSRLGKDYLKDLDGFNLLVRTPILHPRDIIAANPESPDILDKVTSNTNEFFRVCPTKNIIGVTGTKGKGTTSTLIAKMLEACGKTVRLGGNIGTPPLDLLKGAGALHGDGVQGDGEQQTEPYAKYGEGAAEPATQQSAPSANGVVGSAGKQDSAVQSIRPDDWVVLELANFQLIDLKHSPHIAVCLMVEPEHMDWHEDMDEYIIAKQQLFINQEESDIAIYYAKNENSASVADASLGLQIPYMRAPGAEVAKDKITIEGKEICDVRDIKLLGKHNWQNACAAVTAVWQVSKDIEAIKSVLASFAGLPFRIELRREVDGVRFYNDSFASAPDAAIAALQSVPGNKVMIIGGFDRGLDLSGLAKEFFSSKSEIRKVIIIGASADRTAQAMEAAGFTNYVISRDKEMSAIVRRAKDMAEKGDAVILSPGFASFDMFKNFEDRGNQFNEAVAGL